MDDVFKIIGAGIALLIWIAQIVAKTRRDRPLQVPPPRAPMPPPPARLPSPPVPFGAPTGLPPAKSNAAVEEILAALAELETRARGLADSVRWEPQNHRFLQVLEKYLPQEIAALRQTVKTPPVAVSEAYVRLDWLDLVVRETGELVRQRRDPELLAELGDADALADACYRPIVTFANTEGLPLTSMYPATQLAEVNLATWTGFIETSVAPIFLPPGFFRSTAWWPAIAHEIGHDFLASVRGLGPGLRRELGLPDEYTGTRPLVYGIGGLGTSELRRVLGGWFEELFCDVFGTLMCGPGYVASMERLFAARQDPREVLVVEQAANGLYDVHPPRHLRFVVGCMVLERAGFHEDVKQLRTSWEARHTMRVADPEAEGGAATIERGPDRLLFPMPGSSGNLLAIPLDVWLPLVEALVERLYAGPLAPLSGFGLEDVSGLDYGPHEHAQALRAQSDLLASRVPRIHDARAIVSGAVLATRAQPALEPQILAFARAAIPGAASAGERLAVYGTLHDRSQDVRERTEAPVSAALLRESLVLREILMPRRGPRRGRL